MAAKNNKYGHGKELFGFTEGKRQTVYGILLILISIFLFISIISYHSDDVVKWRIGNSGTTKVVPQINVTVDSTSAVSETHNWIGAVGAELSYFFIKRVLGYFSLVFSIVLFIWGFGKFKEIDFWRKVTYSNSLILLALMLATFCGIFSHPDNRLLNSDPSLLSGMVGTFIAAKMTVFLGMIGAFFVLLTAIIILLIFAFDVPFHKWVVFLYEKIIEMMKKENTEDEGDSRKVSPKQNKNGVRIRTSEPDAKEEPVNDEEEKRPQVKIIRKDIESETPKKKGKEKKVKETDESKEAENPIEPEIDEVLSMRESEATLPDPWDEKINYKLPLPEKILDEEPVENFVVADDELRKNGDQLKEKLEKFDIQIIDDIQVTPGPVVTLYEIRPAPGVKIARIVSLENDIALALAAKGIRIIAPIPGKSVVGVEIPNSEPTLVVARSVLKNIIHQKAEIPIALGKTIAGDIYTTDLAKMPHLLVAGSTGSGKSVGINMMIASILFSLHPSQVKLAIIDPKKIELSFYQKLRNHYLAISPDIDEDIVTQPMNAVILLKSIEMEMERRYDMLTKARARNILDYNVKISDASERLVNTAEVKHHYLPYLVVIIDELADLMITAGKEVEEPITRLAQLARAVGIHLVLATQRPSVNVITGVIKANFTTRISYQVASKIDSRTILDMNGAETLLGKGDMLFLPPGSSKPLRLQNAFISTTEVERLTEYVQSQPKYSKPYQLPSIYKNKIGKRGSSSDVDPLFLEAAEMIVDNQQGSVTVLQRRLKLGYARAARIMDQLEEAEIVGPLDSSKNRKVLCENREQLETKIRNI